MLRRTFIKILPSLSALPFFPNHETTEPRLPADGNLLFWYHFYSAITKQQTMSTARSREYVVEQELEMEYVSEQEAIRALELADAGYYSLGDIPAAWRDYFEQVESEFQSRE